MDVHATIYDDEDDLWLTMFAALSTLYTSTDGYSVFRTRPPEEKGSNVIQS
jgi:hypothetical protein